MTNEELDKLAYAAQQESTENQIKDMHNLKCAIGDIQPTSIKALLAYEKAILDMADSIKYEGVDVDVDVDTEDTEEKHIFKEYPGCKPVQEK